MNRDNWRPLDYGKAACDTIMRKFAAEDLPPKPRFHYHAGVFLSGMIKTYQLCKEEKYYQYVKDYVDFYVDREGEVHHSCFHMDDMQAGVLMYDLYKRTGEEHYRKALTRLVNITMEQKRTPEGGFWHKFDTDNQMWLDSLYMGGPIVAQYGQMFDRPLCFEVCAFQAQLMENVCKDDETGLLYHAYDYNRTMPWADPVTGHSPEFWGRAMGWVPVAILEELDYIPETYYHRDDMIRIATDLLKALTPYQDEETGLWYQVVNKGYDPRNWLETSCSCLYVGAMFKAIRKGFLSRSYLRFAKKGYEGIIKRLKWDEKGIVVDGVCIGTGVGNYEHYLNRPTCANDLHGMGAFILMCQEAEQVL
ncbi:MAG: glycoside hydrolase family 88 protein [Clostridia bacterium]|nr:glycoside hydrolase family 88 protein [Clostridia bacterium]